MKLDMAPPTTRKKWEDAAGGKPLEDLKEGGERQRVDWVQVLC